MPFAIQQGDFWVIFVSRDRLVQRAHFKGYIQFARPNLDAAFLAGKSLSNCSFFCQDLVCPPAFFIKKTEHTQVSNTVLRINKSQKIIATLILFADFEGESQVCL